MCFKMALSSLLIYRELDEKFRKASYYFQFSLDIKPDGKSEAKSTFPSLSGQHKERWIGKKP